MTVLVRALERPVGKAEERHDVVEMIGSLEVEDQIEMLRTPGQEGLR